MNTVNLIGRLTKDPMINWTRKNNITIAKFILAVKRNYKSETGETADFIKIVAYGKTAEFAKNYFKKGQQIGLTGRINTRNYEDRNGAKHVITEVVANDLFFADSKKENENNSIL